MVKIDRVDDGAGGSCGTHPKDHDGSSLHRLAALRSPDAWWVKRIVRRKLSPGFDRDIAQGSGGSSGDREG